METEARGLSEAAWQFIAQHREEDVRTLALRSNTMPKDENKLRILAQIEGYQRTKEKIPFLANTKGFLFPRRLSLEQASSEKTAQYKALTVQRLFSGAPHSIADLTGGMGIDFILLAKGCQEALYVEKDEALCALARHNFPLFGLENAIVEHGDASERITTLKNVDLIYLDPARRGAHGEKVVRLYDLQPDITGLLPQLLKAAKRVMLKLSPMFSLKEACAFPGAEEIHIIAVGGECKELLVILRDGKEGEPSIHCTERERRIGYDFTFTLSEEKEAPCHYTEKVGKYLYEPSSALLKAGAFRLLASRHEVKKLHPDSHLYTSDEKREAFPGRTFLVEDICGFSKKELKGLSHNFSQANLTVRGFPSSVESLRQRLSLREGGSAYLFATTLANEKKVLIRCKKTD